MDKRVEAMARIDRKAVEATRDALVSELFGSDVTVEERNYCADLFWIAIAAIEATGYAVVQVEGVEYEIMCAGELVAASNSLGAAMDYAATYRQDGQTEIIEVFRRPLQATKENGDG